MPNQLELFYTTQIKPRCEQIVVNDFHHAMSLVYLSGALFLFIIIIDLNISAFLFVMRHDQKLRQEYENQRRLTAASKPTYIIFNVENEKQTTQDVSNVSQNQSETVE